MKTKQKKMTPYMQLKLTVQKDVACGFLVHLHTVCTQHDIALLEKHKVGKQRYLLDLCPKKEELRSEPGGKGLGRYIWEGTQREGKLRMYGQLFHSVSWVHLV